MSTFVDEQLELLKKRTEEADVVYNLSIIRGIPQNPTFEEEKFGKVIDEFETKDGDTFIATYVKVRK